jgi:molecular chaperone GrpE
MTEQENIEQLTEEKVDKKEEKKEEKTFKKENKELKKLLEEKEKEIAELKKVNEECINKVKYAQAELINYRKRKDEEMIQREKYCNKDIITDLLPIIDNFERAIKYDDNNLEDQFSKFLSGFKIMFSDLNNILVRFGVTPINRVGEEFNPNLEQALLTDKVEGKKDEEVLEVLLKGYMLHDRVIRPATVKINKID